MENFPYVHINIMRVHVTIYMGFFVIVYINIFKKNLFFLISPSGPESIAA
jgi:hypothetical protein